MNSQKGKYLPDFIDSRLGCWLLEWGREEVLGSGLAPEPCTRVLPWFQWHLGLHPWEMHGAREALIHLFSHLFFSCVSVFSVDGSASQAQQLPNSQVLSPDEAVCLRKKKRHSRPDPFARLSDLCHRQLPEDQTAILNSVDHDDPGHATLL